MTPFTSDRMPEAILIKTRSGVDRCLGIGDLGPMNWKSIHFIKLHGETVRKKDSRDIAAAAVLETAEK